ncbi:hypothetical protein WJX74_010206 [Apatococcus lobatus]|uniref:MOSC domain-containing protein n=1 Tax=Apatococcus lobatus TaxID=904363 RepID=A0AAW1RXJ4_9CHLO
MPKVSSLTVYPVKGLKGIELQQAKVTRTGLRFDRNWMVVDARSGQFITQREMPRLALISTHLPLELLTGEWGAASAEAALTLSTAAPVSSSVQIPLDGSLLEDSNKRECRCWSWEGPAQDQGNEAADWLSDFLGSSVRLMRYTGQPDWQSNAGHDSTRARRQVDPSWLQFAPEDEIAFQDNFPILMASEGGLAALNSHLEHPVPMNRFRPNLVVDDRSFWAEDTWEAIEFHSASSPDPNATESNLKLRLAAPASRCSVTTVNQTTAERGKEPLRTLGKIRRGKQLGWTLRPEWKPAAFFGWNVVPLREGLIAVGDDVEVLGQRSITSLSA